MTSFPVPPIVLALALALVLAAPFSFLAGRRGGRYRTLPGWVGFWTFFAGLLVCLSRADRWISFPILALFLFAALKKYFFVAPVRPQDRWAILATYISIPYALFPAFVDSYDLFLLLVPVALFFFLPIVLAVAPRQAGLLDSMGRIQLGVLVFVFGAAHLGMMVHLPPGRLELFGITALLAELPQRLAGRLRPGEDLLRPLSGVLVGIGLGVCAGAYFGRFAAITTWQGGVAGLLVALTATGGGLVVDAVAHDLELGPLASRVGRGGFLDRAVPAVYAAPVFYHYLKTLG